MPRHEQISPEEDLATFYGGAGPRPGAAPSAGEAAAPDTAPASGARPDPASAPRRLAPVQRPMPTFAPPSGAAEPPRPEIAAVLSLVLPGAGQLYAGQAAKGGALVVFGLFTCMLGGLLNVLAALDAYRIAQRRVRGETVDAWQIF